MKIRTINLNTFCIGLLISVLSISCKSEKGDAGGPGGPGVPGGAEGVAEYKVLKLAPETITLYDEFPATIEGIENIEIRPKIEGFIEKVLVDEGQYVKKGDLLFMLNAPEYAQEVRNTKAAISSVQAEVSSAQLDVEKAKPLVEREIIEVDPNKKTKYLNIKLHGNIDDFKVSMKKAKKKK